jgi:serine/threonine protein kinase
MTKKLAFEEARTFEFVQRESQNLYDLIKRKEIDDYWDIIEIIFEIKKLSSEFKELFIKMVAYNPSERPSFEEIMNSKWMKEIKEADENQLNELREKMITEIKKAGKEEQNN